MISVISVITILLCAATAPNQPVPSTSQEASKLGILSAAGTPGVATRVPSASGTRISGSWGAADALAVDARALVIGAADLAGVVRGEERTDDELAVVLRRRLTIASAGTKVGSAPEPLPDATRVLATRVRYTGAPHPRWWQIEQAHADVGGHAPDRSHFSTLLLIDIVTSHSDDWFTFPVAARSGHVLTLHEVTVVDAFGDPWDIQPPDDGWTLFGVTGLGQRSLVL